ncbi:hypothetical protein [Clostridium cellulovorans]|uniref:Uncharacterized protein n=1 Tax=Clostridium cellulovorans (strain ATCC 35296 / DSM 3052 / OCM 3 / 743B) TaxID=573061 RepID=D9SV90_CLOC7|nr:hypothetical protein [Clostridium cellulovorans]ADL53064.1 hypothetical protein Clocel_3385 [Clostridium cellulovorans 743B]
MKYNDAFDILKNVSKGLKDSNFVSEKFEKNDLFNIAKEAYLNTTANTKVYPQYKKYNQHNRSVPIDVIDSFNSDTVNSEPLNDESMNSDSMNNIVTKEDNSNIDYNSKKQYTSSNPQGLLDSIAEELTPTKLQQAIVLSEIVGKPRSKTRKKRRF